VGGWIAGENEKIEWVHVYSLKDGQFRGKHEHTIEIIFFCCCAHCAFRCSDAYSILKESDQGAWAAACQVLCGRIKCSHATATVRTAATLLVKGVVIQRARDAGANTLQGIEDLQLERNMWMDAPRPVQAHSHFAAPAQ